MTFNPNILVANYRAISDDNNDDDNDNIEVLGQRPANLGNRYNRRGATLLESNALGVFDFHKGIIKPRYIEEYLKGLAKITKKYTKKF